MRPWSDYRHKCLVGVDRGESLFSWHLRNVAEAMPGAVVYGNVPRAWLGEFKAEAGKLGMHGIRWVPEDEILRGSGNRAMDVARRHGTALVLYGDTWFAPTWYERMRPGYMPFHAVIGVEGLPKNKSDWRGFIVLRKDRGAEVVSGVDERPTRRYRDTDAAFHMGMSVYTRRAAEVIAKDAALSARDDVDLFSEAVPEMVRCGLDVGVLRGGAYNAESADLGTPERYAAFIVGRYLREAPVGAADAAAVVMRAHRVAIAGNGGACCVASHAALDWCKAGRKWTVTFMEPGMLSAWSNDAKFEDAVARQVGMHEWSPDDALVLLSTSGKSPNILAAARAAKALPGKCRPRVVGVTCSEDNPLAAVSDVSVRISGPAPRNTWTYGPLEDAMSEWCHAVTAVLEGVAPWPGRRA